MPTGRSPRSRPERPSSARSRSARRSRTRNGCWRRLARPPGHSGRRSSSRSTSRWIASGRCSPTADRRGPRDLVAVPFHAGRPGQHPAVRRAGRRLDPGRRLLPDPPGAAAVRRRARSARRSPTPSGRPTAPTRSCGAPGLPRRPQAGVLVRFPSGYDTLTRVLGTEGEIRMTGPFHPDAEDEVVVMRDGGDRSAARADVRRDVVHPGDPAHPSRGARTGGAASPGRGRGDGEREAIAALLAAASSARAATGDVRPKAKG